MQKINLNHLHKLKCFSTQTRPVVFSSQRLQTVPYVGEYRAVSQPLWDLSLETNRPLTAATPWPILFKTCRIHFSEHNSLISLCPTPTSVRIDSVGSKLQWPFSFWFHLDFYFVTRVNDQCSCSVCGEFLDLSWRANKTEVNMCSNDRKD